MDWMAFLAEQIGVTPEEMREIVKVAELKTVVNIQLKKPLKTHLFKRLVRVVYMLNGEYLPERKTFKIPRQRRTSWEEATEVLTELVPNELKGGIVVELLIKPLRFLKHEDFKKLAERIEKAGGAYVSSKSTYFRLLVDPPCKTPQERLLFQLRHQKLTAYEISVRLNELVSKYGLTQEQIASQIHRSRSWVANHLRIIQLKGKLPLRILKNISEGVARILLSAPDQKKLAEEYVTLVKSGVTPTMKMLQERLNALKNGSSIKKEESSHGGSV